MNLSLSGEDNPKDYKSTKNTLCMDSPTLLYRKANNLFVVELMPIEKIEHGIKEDMHRRGANKRFHGFWNIGHYIRNVKDGRFSVADVRYLDGARGEVNLAAIFRDVDPLYKTDFPAAVFEASRAAEFYRDSLSFIEEKALEAGANAVRIGANVTENTPQSPDAPFDVRVGLIGYFCDAKIRRRR